MIVMAKWPLANLTGWLLLTMASFLFLQSCGGSSWSGGGGGGGGQTTTPPAAPTGLTATAGNLQVALTWNASTGAASYNVERATATGGPYTQVANTAQTSDTDRALRTGLPISMSSPR